CTRRGYGSSHSSYWYFDVW
nr:immunoglobulin heavy chain junction region [Mus musculus]MBK4197923.1 immunoglobulin heavy chain junction region [Mus musculus]MBK4197924.1 immunoglobulin heavy chain junction region [Mus musculus]